MDLHDALMAAPEVTPEPVAPRRQRPYVRYLAAAAVVAVLGIGGAIVATRVGETPAAADVKVTEKGGTVTVVVSKEVSVEQLHSELQKAGVKVRVLARTTGPSQVNAFVAIAGPPDAILPTSGFRKSIATFRSGSKVTLYLGVAAPSGKPYDVGTDATHPGEPFAGLAIIGQPLGQVHDTVEATAAAHDVTVEYRAAGGQPTTTPDPAARVIGATSVTSDKVLIFLR
jgi:hypothetical protein